MAKFWSNEEVKLLKELFNKGVPDLYIGRELGRSGNAVKCKRIKMKIIGDHSARRFTKEGKERMSQKPKGSKSHKWKGGRRISHGGYIELFRPDHHRARKNGYVFEHIIVAEEKIGRRLMLGEVVHHIDKDKTNNNPANLMVLSSSLHAKKHKRIKSGVYKTCPVCKKMFYVKTSHLEKRTTCSLKCAGVLFRKYYLGKPRDHKVSRMEKEEVLRSVESCGFDRAVSE